MKIFKRIMAVSLVLIMVLSLSACIHKKDEIAVTIGDVEFTSAYYMCALLNADSEAKQKVGEDEENLTDEEKEGTAQIDYYSKKIDDKSFVKWVEDRALEMLKDIAAYRTLCKDNKIELTDDQKKEAEETASYYWNSYGYSAYFQPNGVSEATYKSFTEDNYYAEEYFQHIYGKDGTKALAEDDVKKQILDNYILVDIVQSQYTEELTDEQKTARKELLEMNADYIKKGEKTFVEVYKEINNITDEEEHEHEHEEGEIEPVNQYATVLGAEGTGENFENEYYETFKGYEIDEPQVIEAKDASAALLVIKRDLTKDQYYMDTLDAYARHSLADEDFEKEIAKFSKDLKVNVNKYAVSQFKVKKIIVPESTY